MDYTIKNLHEVEDQAPKFGFDQVQEARFPYRDLEAEATGMAFHRVNPGQRQGFAHRHKEAEEIYVILAGSGRIKLDDDVREMARSTRSGSRRRSRAHSRPAMVVSNCSLSAPGTKAMARLSARTSGAPRTSRSTSGACANPRAAESLSPGLAPRR